VGKNGNFGGGGEKKGILENVCKSREISRRAQVRAQAQISRELIF